jgi:hypothetical protein
MTDLSTKNITWPFAVGAAIQQRDYETIRLVQDALLSQEENKRRNDFNTGQGIHAIGKAALVGSPRPSRAGRPVEGDMMMKQQWEIASSSNWKRIFLHESGHALMAVLQAIPCYGIFYRGDKDTACALTPPLPAHSLYSKGHYLFLAAGSGAEATKYTGMSFFGSRADRKLFGGTPAQFSQSVEEAYNIFLGKLDLLTAVASKVQANFDQAGSDFKRLPQCEKSIENVQMKVGVLLSEAELNDITM